MARSRELWEVPDSFYLQTLLRHCLNGAVIAIPRKMPHRSLPGLAPEALAREPAPAVGDGAREDRGRTLVAQLQDDLRNFLPRELGRPQREERTPELRPQPSTRLASARQAAGHYVGDEKSVAERSLLLPRCCLPLRNRMLLLDFLLSNYQIHTAAAGPRGGPWPSP